MKISFYLIYLPSLFVCDNLSLVIQIIFIPLLSEYVLVTQIQCLLRNFIWRLKL